MLLGDRIEVYVLGMVFGCKRLGFGFLMIGSIKLNIGYLEGVVGIVGLIKVVLMVECGLLFLSGGFMELNLVILFMELGLRVVDEFQEWLVVVGWLCWVGVLLFGFGGINVYVIVEEVGLVGVDMVLGCVDVGGFGGGVVVWVILGKMVLVLVVQVGWLGWYVWVWLVFDVVDVGYLLVSMWLVFDYWVVVVGQICDELLVGLVGVVVGWLEVGVVCGVGKLVGKMVFVFVGQGLQWLGMGSEFYVVYLVFVEVFDVVVDELDWYLWYLLCDVIWGYD